MVILVVFFLQYRVDQTQNTSLRENILMKVDVRRDLVLYIYKYICC